MDTMGETLRLMVAMTFRPVRVKLYRALLALTIRRWRSGKPPKPGVSRFLTWLGRDNQPTGLTPVSVTTDPDLDPWN